MEASPVALACGLGQAARPCFSIVSLHQSLLPPHLLQWRGLRLVRACAAWTRDRHWPVTTNQISNRISRGGLPAQIRKPSHVTLAEKEEDKGVTRGRPEGLYSVANASPTSLVRCWRKTLSCNDGPQPWPLIWGDSISSSCLPEGWLPPPIEFILAIQPAAPWTMLPRAGLDT